MVYGNPEQARLPSVLQRLVRWAAGRDVALWVGANLAWALEDGAAELDSITIYEAEATAAELFDPAQRSMLLCLGGDGTLIHAVSHLWPFQIPVASVNLGSLGFNAYVEPEEIESFILDWEAGRTRTSERMIVEVGLWRGEVLLREGVAVNDVVLLKEGPRVIRIALSQGDELISSFAADGLIMSTPTGSTAYNLSAGGPIVHPTMQALIATMICPHSLASRPVVLPPSPEVRLRFDSKHGQEEANLSIDGQESWQIGPADVVTLKAAPQSLQLVTPAEMQYFARLRRKLSWSTEPHAAARTLLPRASRTPVWKPCLDSTRQGMPPHPPPQMRPVPR